MKTALQLAGIVALLAVGGSAVWIAHSTAHLRTDLNATQESLAASVESARADLAITQAAMVNVLNRRTGELTAQTNKLSGAVSRSLSKADGTFADLAKIREDLRAPIAQSVGTLRVTTDVLQQTSETLGAIHAATVDAQAIADDLYPDAKALMASATVTSTSAAQVSQEIRRVAPDVATDAQKTVKNARRLTSWPVVLGKALLSIPKKLFWFL